MISEREKLEFESLPEFVREPYSAGREPYTTSAPATPSINRSSYKNVDDRKSYDSVEPPPVLEKSAELEALWPGVSHHEFLQSSRRPPSFLIGAGFVGGVVATLIGVWSISLFQNGAPSTTVATSGQKKIVVAGGNAAAKSQAANNHNASYPIVVGGAEVVSPNFGSYEVQTGDTLAGIAYKAYKRVSPRLLDEICKANGMRNANVLSQGQKLLLPEYHPQTSQVAAAGGTL